MELILRRRKTPSFRTGSRAPLSINPEQTPGFRPGNVEELIHEKILPRWMGIFLKGKGCFGIPLKQSLDKFTGIEFSQVVHSLADANVSDRNL